MKINYQEIQELLKMTFKSEKMYYEAAEILQIVELKRFLNHQSVERNKYANELTESLVFNNIEPDMLFVKKGIQKLNRLDLKIVLENSKYIHVVRKCMSYDEDIIDKCALIARDKVIPVDILEVTTRLMTFLIFQGIDGSQIIEELKEKDNQKKKTKVIQFKNNLL
ncbi:hypothetical protein AWE51_14970 [Aquimarina aggregata]|uniref:DUF2383 domain-containing protein n=1 Tax=Aquimarina aggregata TaxID=1642818 RepID=A0A162Y1L3_9FLAO|nr:hypothetical protein [Aquimarina aggregata]KZS38880.1 hypothetical protein AWE51_14970 [Aquimarina aggregata]